MSILPRTSLLAALALAAACGDKVPQSEAAKKVGDQPKQIIDKAATDVGKAMQAPRPDEEKK